MKRFGAPLGPDLEPMGAGASKGRFQSISGISRAIFGADGRVGIQGSILKHFWGLQGQIWSRWALGHPGVEFEAFLGSAWRDLELMGALASRD